MNEKQNTTANDPAVAPLPCPFCGCKTITVVEGSTFRWAKGECDNCGACCGEVRVNTMQTRNEDEIRAAVVEEWNKRHGSPHLIPASIFPTSVPALSAGLCVTAQLTGSFTTITAPTRTEKTSPYGYRLAKKPDGTLVLQGAYFWQEGWNTYGHEWRDIPTVDLETPNV